MQTCSVVLLCVRIFSGGWGMEPQMAFTLHPKILTSRIKNKKNNSNEESRIVGKCLITPSNVTILKLLG